MTPEECLQSFAAERDEMLDVLKRLVTIDSPSCDRNAVARFVLEYGALLEQAGIEWRAIDGPNGPHLFAEIEGPKESPPIVLVGHSDTVWPLGEAGRRPPRRDGVRLYGPGVYDMRAGLTAAFFALRRLAQDGASPRRTVQLFLSADEEVGSTTAHPHMDRLLPAGATALVLEPPLPDGALKLRRKGAGMYRLEVHGVEAHAGLEPERGASAIAELARQILAVLPWADPARGITLNFGEIEGGIASNVVAGFAAAGLDVRFDELPAGEEVHQRLQALRPVDERTRLTVTGGIIFPPMIPTPASEQLAEVAVGLARELGLKIGSGKAGGGSDGCHLAARGLIVLDGLGVDGAGAHTAGEYIRMDRLPVRAALLYRLILALLGGR